MMSTAEIKAAEQAIKSLGLCCRKTSRRYHADVRGRLIDMRQSLKIGADILVLVLPQWRRRRAGRQADCHSAGYFRVDG